MFKFRLETNFNEEEIGSLPKDWKVDTLRTIVASLESGNRPKGGRLFSHTPNGILNIGGKNITWQNELLLEDCFRVDETFYSQAKRGKLEDEDILLVKDGATIGKLFYVSRIPEEKAMVNEHVFLIKLDKSKYSPRFLFYYFFSEVGQQLIENSIGGSAQGGLNRSILDTIIIPVLDFSEQSRIATILSWFDDLAEKKKRQIQILEKIVVAIFRSWFIDLEPFETGEFVNAKMGRMPKGWRTVPIGELVRVRKGISYKGEEKFEEPIGYVFVTLNNIIEGGGFKPEYSWIKSDRIKNHHFLREGDLIVANTHFGVGGSETGRLLGAPALVVFPYYYKEVKGVYSHHITRIEPVDDRLTYFLYLYLQVTQEESTTYQTGTTVLSLDMTNFKRNKLVLLPSQRVLEKFHSVVDPLFQKIALNQKQIMVLRKIRDTLLPLLVLGKLRVEGI